MLVLVGALLIILLYGWSSQVGDVFPYRPSGAATVSKMKQKFAGKATLAHFEVRSRSTLQWLVGSSVCDLGKAAWVGWVVAIAVLLAVGPGQRPAVRYTFWGLLVLTTVLSGVMNPPLAVRSLPAFVGLAVLIPWLT